MKKLNKNEHGFSPIELILVALVVLLIVGGGYYVYKTRQNNKPSTTTQSSTTVSAPKQSTQPTTSYFTITQWGVRAPNTGTDTYTYELSNGDKLANVVSKQLAAKDSGCSTFGAGQIKRLLPTDGAYADGSGPAVKEYSKQYPNDYTLVNGYYYQFVHNQAACGTTIPVTDQNQANDAVKAMVAKFESVPS